MARRKNSAASAEGLTPVSSMDDLYNVAATPDTLSALSADAAATTKAQETKPAARKSTNTLDSALLVLVLAEVVLIVAGWTPVNGLGLASLLITLAAALVGIE